MDNNNLEKFMLETKCNINESNCFFEQNKHITDIDDMIDLYIKINKIECHICYEKSDKLYMFVPCNHRIICKNCAELYLSKYEECINSGIDKCPICREKWLMISEKEPLCLPPILQQNNTDFNNTSPNMLFIGIHHEIIPMFNEENIMFNRRRKICKFYKNGYCSRGNNCCYRHLSDYQNIQRAPIKEDYCKHFLQKGNCNYGEYCNFIHDVIPAEIATP